MNKLPAVGTYLLPVQWFRAGYCLQVVAVIDCTESHEPGITQLQCRRWGLDDQRQPYDDGHCGPAHHGYYTGRFRSVGAQAWRNDAECWLGPLYFKQIPAPTVAGQLNLFQ